MMKLFVCLASKQGFESNEIKSLDGLCKECFILKEHPSRELSQINDYFLVSYEIWTIFLGYEYMNIYCMIDFLERIVTSLNRKNIDLLSDFKDIDAMIQSYIQFPYQRGNHSIYITPIVSNFTDAFYQSELCQAHINYTLEEWGVAEEIDRPRLLESRKNGFFQFDVSFVSRVKLSRLHKKHLYCKFRDAFPTRVWCMEYDLESVGHILHEFTIDVQWIEIDHDKKFEAVHKLIRIAEDFYIHFPDTEVDIIANTDDNTLCLNQYQNDNLDYSECGIFVTKKPIDPTILFYHSEICNVVFNIDYTGWWYYR